MTLDPVVLIDRHQQGKTNKIDRRHLQTQSMLVNNLTS